MMSLFSIFPSNPHVPHLTHYTEAAKERQVKKPVSNSQLPTYFPPYDAVDECWIFFWYKLNLMLDWKWEKVEKVSCCWVISTFFRVFHLISFTVFVFIHPTTLHASSSEVRRSLSLSLSPLDTKIIHIEIMLVNSNSCCLAVMLLLLVLRILWFYDGMSEHCVEERRMNFYEFLWEITRRKEKRGRVSEWDPLIKTNVIKFFRCIEKLKQKVFFSSIFCILTKYTSRCWK